MFICTSWESPVSEDNKKKHERDWTTAEQVRTW